MLYVLCKACLVIRVALRKSTQRMISDVRPRNNVKHSSALCLEIECLPEGPENRLEVVWPGLHGLFALLEIGLEYLLNP